MNPNGAQSPVGVLLVAQLDRQAMRDLAARYHITIEWLDDTASIPGSFWGAPEAGIMGTSVYVRPDTPVHSLLHEFSHVICMPPEVRLRHAGNAESDDLEESAVCYLQILLADELPGAGHARLMQDMDCWGYSFRLGSTRRWFDEDADDARAWLHAAEIIDGDGKLTWRLRSGSVL